MDISALLSTFMSANSTEGISRATGVSNDQTRSILSSALPMLLGGALSQSTGSSTASGFAGALTQHALDNTSDVGAFMSGVDMKDGEKIVNHLLGSNSDAVVAQIAGNSGVKKADVKKVLAAAAPPSGPRRCRWDRRWICRRRAAFDEPARQGGKRAAADAAQ